MSPYLASKNSSSQIWLRQGVVVSIVDRIREVRVAEGFTQPDFCAETGLKLDTLRKYEQGRTQGIGSAELEKITTHPRFEKYALWLVTGKVAPEAGQISPEIEQQRTA